MNASPPPPLESPPASKDENTTEALKRVEDRLGTVLAGLVDVSARLSKVEAVVGAGAPAAPSPATYTGPERRAPAPSYTNEVVSRVHDETFRQTGKLDSMLPAVLNASAKIESMAPAVQNANTRQWITLAAVLVQSIATIAYAFSHTH